MRPDSVQVRAALAAAGIEVEPLRVDVPAFRDYARRARYERFRGYYGGAPPLEKVLEHFLARDLLGLTTGDVLLDVAGSNSPAFEIYRELDGVDARLLDRAARPGERTIRADVSAMPLPDESVSKMTLHCAFEHFEGDADGAFVREARRVLRPGGACCIAPLYLSDEYSVQTDPRLAGGVTFEDDAVVHFARGWGERHGRFYDVAHLQARVLAHLGPLRLRLLRVENAAVVSPSCYVEWVALLVKER